MKSAYAGKGRRNNSAALYFKGIRFGDIIIFFHIMFLDVPSNVRYTSKLYGMHKKESSTRFRVI